jgi:hypothetical protein
VDDPRFGMLYGAPSRMEDVFRLPSFATSSSQGRDLEVSQCSGSRDKAFRSRKASFKLVDDALDDLLETEPVFCQSLKWLLGNEVGEDSDFDFTVTKEGFGTTEIVELIPDGKNISVTDENKDLYVSLQVQWRVNGSILDQVNAMRRGFAELIPNSHVSVFSPEELLLLLNGKSKIDVEEMLASTRYTGGYQEDSMTVKLFWKVFETMSQEERQNVLKFATGATRVPLDGFDPQFTITMGSDGIENLPSAHTCFNQLVLPPYIDTASLEEKLVMAVTETASFELT